MYMHPFSCGSYVVDRGVLDNAHWGERYEHPIPMYAFRHPRGVVVFDTGHSHRGLEDPVAWYGEKTLAGFLDIRVREEDCLPAQLRSVGIEPEEVTHVILSHLHIDHAGEMASFPDALFVLRASELPYAWWSPPNQRNSYIMNDLLPTRNFRYLELPDGLDFDLFGDGSLVCVHTPGHTPGHQSLLARLPERGRTLVLCGDACYGEANLRGSPPSAGVLCDAPLWYRSIERLRHWEALGHELWFGHDMEDWLAKTALH